MCPMAEFLRDNRLIWLGHVQRRDKYEATKKITQMTLGGKQNRGRLNMRWRDLMKEDMARNQMTTVTKMVEDRKHCHVMIQAGILRNLEAESEKVRTRCSIVI